MQKKGGGIRVRQRQRRWDVEAALGLQLATRCWSRWGVGGGGRTTPAWFRGNGGDAGVKWNAGSLVRHAAAAADSDGSVAGCLSVRLSGMQKTVKRTRNKEGGRGWAQPCETARQVGRKFVDTDGVQESLEASRGDNACPCWGLPGGPWKPSGSPGRHGGGRGGVISEPRRTSPASSPPEPTTHHTKRRNACPRGGRPAASHRGQNSTQRRRPRRAETETPPADGTPLHPGGKTSRFIPTSHKTCDTWGGGGMPAAHFALPPRE